MRLLTIVLGVLVVAAVVVYHFELQFPLAGYRYDSSIGTYVKEGVAG